MFFIEGHGSEKNKTCSISHFWNKEKMCIACMHCFSAGQFKQPSSCLSFPGTSLLQEIVYLVSQGADPDEIGLMNIDEQLPVLEYPQPGLDIIQVAQNVLSCPDYWRL